MPAYAHMGERDLDISLTTKKLKAMQAMGVPYSDSLIANADAVLQAQSLEIQASLEKSKIKTSEKKEIIAMIAYLQRLGKDIKAQPAAVLAPVDPALGAAPAPATVPAVIDSSAVNPQ